MCTTAGAQWNVLYHELLAIGMPQEAELVAFTDDLAVVITAKNAKIGIYVGDEAFVESTNGWKEMNLKSTRKKQMPGLKKCDGVKFGIDTVIPQDLKSLGVIIHRRLNSGKHVTLATEKSLRESCK
ncbi:hypothetical protein HHI36_008124 [Cryptolaemus montrouzieri]|uniref:Reverse transcriptase domain-containing protein n=1 Tax=Cryptolaemus montrouzieri TaxID=559131 RepID=A0ABD2MRE9_9CUCU